MSKLKKTIYRFGYSIFSSLKLIFMNKVTKKSEFEDPARIAAVELYKKALKLEEQKDYFGAKKYYEQSLELYNIEEVQTSYLRLLAIIGPL